VDGKRFEIREAEKPKDPPKGDITGKWKLSYTTPEGAEESTADLSMASDGTISGTLSSKRGNATILSGYLSGDHFSFVININIGQNFADVTFSGTYDGNSMKGQHQRGRLFDRFHGKQTERRIFARGSCGLRPRGCAMNRRLHIIAVAALSLVGASCATLAAPPPDSGPVIVIQNATILTVTRGTIERGSILIKDGKIAEVGPSVKAPKDATVIDAEGKFVTPGIIDCHSHIAIDGSVNEGSISVSSIANTAEVLNSDDIDIYRDLAGGVTTANILHGSANAIGGQTVVIKLRWGQPASKLPFEGALPGIKFALGENPKRSNFSVPGQPKRYPATRMGVEETIRAAFTEARDYKNAWDAYNKKVAAGDKTAQPPRRDLAPRPSRGSSGREALRPLPLLSRRRNPDAPARGEGIRLQGAYPSARS
jgi:hypothetical protein